MATYVLFTVHTDDTDTDDDDDDDDTLIFYNRQSYIFKTWIFLLFFGGNWVQLFFLAMSTTMFGVDRNSVKYAIHTNNHTQSTNYVLVKY